MTLHATHLPSESACGLPELEQAPLTHAKPRAAQGMAELPISDHQQLSPSSFLGNIALTIVLVAMLLVVS